MKKLRKYRVLLLGLVLMVLATGCSGEEETTGQPVVYASFYPVYDLAKSIAGDSLDLRSFMPPNKDPHLWEPTPRDMKKLAESDLLIVNGANMEKWLDKVSESLPDLNILRLSDSLELISYTGAAAEGDFQYMAELDLDSGKYEIEFGHTHEESMKIGFYHDTENLSEGDLIEIGKEIMEGRSEDIKQQGTIDIESAQAYSIEMGHETGLVYYEIEQGGRWIFYSDRLSENILPYELLDQRGDLLERQVLLESSTSGMDKVTYDPHSWLSLVNAKVNLRDIERELIRLYPENKRIYERNRLNAIEEITSLEYEYRDKFKDIEINEFVVTHYAYAYLARDFDLRQFPLSSLASMESPSLNTIRRALDFCEIYDIDTIFYEANQDKRDAESLASELGGQSMPLVSMEYVNPDREDSESKYVDLMRENLENIYESLR